MPVTITKKQERQLPRLTAAEFFDYVLKGGGGSFTIRLLEDVDAGEVPANAFAVAAGGRKFAAWAPGTRIPAPVEGSRVVRPRKPIAAPTGAVPERDVVGLDVAAPGSVVGGGGQ